MFAWTGSNLLNIKNPNQLTNKVGVGCGVRVLKLGPVAEWAAMGYQTTGWLIHVYVVSHCLTLCIPCSGGGI